MKQITLAEQQFIGYVYGREGYSVTALVKGMGLTKKEWSDLKNKVFISEMQKEEIDEYFAKADDAAKEGK